MHAKVLFSNIEESAIDANIDGIIEILSNYLQRTAMNISTKFSEIDFLNDLTKATTVVSIDLNIVGNISTKGIVNVKGKVEGDIRSDKIVIETGGLVEGCIYANELVIFGKFHGKIQADKVEIASSGLVEGELIYQRLTIDDGAYLDVSFQKRV